MLLFLTGLMGSGKTTVGKRLAKTLGWRFVDTDRLVARRAGKSIPRIFSAPGGEARFRRLESAALKSLRGPRNLVVATGGGIVLKAANRAWMRRQGLVVHLKLGPEAILKRLGPSEAAKRPLLAKGGAGALADLARKRAKFYATAEFQVPASGPPKAVCRAILRKIKARVDTQKPAC